jgi:hypothetical protein
MFPVHIAVIDKMSKDVKYYWESKKESTDKDKLRKSTHRQAAQCQPRPQHESPP